MYTDSSVDSHLLVDPHLLFLHPQLPNIISSELYPTHARSAGVAAATGTQFACNAFVVAAFPTLRAVLGEKATLSSFAGLSFLAWIFVLR